MDVSSVTIVSIARLKFLVGYADRKDPTCMSPLASPGTTAYMEDSRERPSVVSDCPGSDDRDHMC